MAKGNKPPVLNEDGSLSDDTKRALVAILETNEVALKIFTDGMSEIILPKGKLLVGSGERL